MERQRGSHSKLLRRSCSCRQNRERTVAFGRGLVQSSPLLLAVGCRLEIHALLSTAPSRHAKSVCAPLTGGWPHSRGSMRFSRVPRSLHVLLAEEAARADRIRASREQARERTSPVSLVSTLYCSAVRTVNIYWILPKKIYIKLHCFTNETCVLR